jgi:hypothetical protein
MHIKEIIRLAGGPSKVARALARSHTTVIGWERVPAEHARRVAVLAGLHPSKVRADLYDEPSSSASDIAA